MISQLTISAQTGICDFCNENGLSELYNGSLYEPSNCAWLLYYLKAAMDLPRWFPKGKWATIQRLESLIYDEACKLLGEQMRASS